MFTALVRKDMRLMKHYLIAAIAVSMGCYVAMAVAVFWFSQYQDASMQTVPVCSFLILRSGHNLGFGATAFCAVLIAGSVFTLERADRSEEFLACLPPSRMQHLMSKLCVLFGATTMMIAVHIAATISSDLLLPYVRQTPYPFTDGTQLSAVLMFVSIILSMIGGALAVSSWQKSNGVPILCGLLTPLGLVALLQLVVYMLDIPMSTREEFSSRFSTTALVVGASLTFCGAYWYVERVEP